MKCEERNDDKRTSSIFGHGKSLVYVVDCRNLAYAGLLIKRYSDTKPVYKLYHSKCSCYFYLYLRIFSGGGITSFADVIHFYKKRVKRFYFLFLFLFSCISLYVIHLFVSRVDFIVSVKQLVCTVTGLSCFIAPMPLTIWYFSMMIFFYIITPLVNVKKTNNKRESTSMFCDLCFSRFYKHAL